MFVILSEENDYFLRYKFPSANYYIHNISSFFFVVDNDNSVEENESLRDGRRSFKVISVGILSFSCSCHLYFLLHHFVELNEGIILFHIYVRGGRSRTERQGGGAH